MYTTCAHAHRSYFEESLDFIKKDSRMVISTILLSIYALT